jgi:predicted nucleotidyltransferase
MDKKDLIKKIQRYFDDHREVIFGYIFGSFIKSDVYRDIDIAIYTKPEVNLLHRGLMQAEITALCKKDVDLILLNKLPDKNPSLAFEIVSHGKRIKNQYPPEHTEYKRKALIRYFDTAGLRKQLSEAFTRRLENDQFVRRNYG